MDKHRIVITGLGLVAPNGIGKEEFWNNCFAGVSGIKPITFFDGLNLEASDKQAMEQLGVQYVDQRRTFTKLITTVKQTALRHNLSSPNPHSP